MNEPLHPNTASNVPWPTSDDRVQVPDTSMLPGTESAPLPAVKLLNQAVKEAHATVDRLAVSAAPVARQLGERVAAAEGSLRVNAERLRQTRDEWAEGMRSNVRSSPLMYVAAAAALGLVIARLIR